MARTLPALVLGLFLAPLSAGAQEVTLETSEQKYSYALGAVIGGNVAGEGFPNLDADVMAQGLRDALAGGDLKLTDEQMAEAMQALQLAKSAAELEAAQGKLSENKAFLDENGKKDGITTTESGLQYKVEKAGEGTSPAATDTVKVHYEGQLLSGKVFDSSYARGTPAEFGVGQVIPGWTEALQLMKPGAIWQVWLPSEIAYGARGAGQDIGPNEVLTFKIELIEVVGK